MFPLLRALTLLSLLALALPALAQNQQDHTLWPRDISAANMKATIYQPQLDAWNGRNLQAHAAVAVLFSGQTQPIYGVINLKGITYVNKDTHTAALSQVDEFTVIFPSAPDEQAAFIEAMRGPILQSVEYMSLDHLQTAASILQATDDAPTLMLNNTPPQIIIAQSPALLVSIDGPARWLPVAGVAGVERLINTKVLLLRDNSTYYLHFLDGYLVASDLRGPWQIADKRPAWANQAEKQTAAKVDMLSGQETKAALAKLKQTPTIYVANKPCELIVIEGDPNYATLAGVNLLYLSNTSANVFKSLDDQQNYVLIGGRWFKAAALTGPWSYVASRDLPADFSRIADDSPKENVKASIAGTSQAREAIIANQIPQTARIDRRNTKFTPVLDGPPRLAPITGTNLQYVLNSPDPIIKAEQQLYALHNGVWFTAAQIQGPWQVATSLPPEIYAIPASSPMHYAVYVKIYNVTDDYVEEGYTPGYYGAMVSDEQTIVYGSGYQYNSWTENNWYGAPATYGSGAAMAWTPWAGWAMGFGFGLLMASAWEDNYWYPPSPWWGPYWNAPAYYHGEHLAWGPGGWAGTSGNIYHRWGNTQVVSRDTVGFDAATGNRFQGHYGQAYNSRTGQVAVGGRGVVQNVYTGNYAAGREGIVYNPNTGAAAAGGRAVVGQPGNAALVQQRDIHTAGGRDIHTSSVRTAEGSVGHINNNIYGSRDGHVYRYDADNPDHWQPLNPNRQQSEYHRNNEPRLNHDFQARQLGQQHSRAFESHSFNRAGGFHGGGGGGRHFRR